MLGDIPPPRISKRGVLVRLVFFARVFREQLFITCVLREEARFLSSRRGNSRVWLLKCLPGDSDLQIYRINLLISHVKARETGFRLAVRGILDADGLWMGLLEGPLFKLFTCLVKNGASTPVKGLVISAKYGAKAGCTSFSFSKLSPSYLAMVVDCRSLIQFCRAFEQYRSMANSLTLRDGSKQPSYGGIHSRSSLKRQISSSATHRVSSLSAFTSSPSPLCEKSSAAAVDVAILVLVLGACGFLFTPYFKYLCTEVVDILPLTLVLIGEVLYQVPIAYICGAVLMVILGVVVWELIRYQARKCENPKCRGLKKAVEFDIQLESEKCVKSMSSSSPSAASSSFVQEAPWKNRVELGNDHKELEAELKRMAPLNGRAVLLFRNPCGCPKARMEVWGAKKPRKSKK